MSVDASKGTIAGRLSFDVAEETYHLGPSETLTFGRAGKAVVDADNPYMHRVVGRVYVDRWSWWLQNSARHMPMSMIGDDDRHKTLPAGAAEPLTTATGAVRFYAGASGYELTWELEQPPAFPASQGCESDTLDGVTADFGNVRLSNNQRLMMAVMAEPRLRDPSRLSQIPANAEIAARCGWTLKQFDRKLDYLCRRLADSGVPGLRGNPGTEAANRRELLVAHVVNNGLITADDLALLDGTELPVSEDNSC
jgi:hypothetical protein